MYKLMKQFLFNFMWIDAFKTNINLAVELFKKKCINFTVVKKYY